MDSLYGFIVWNHCMGSLHGITVWIHCMESLYGIIAGLLESAYSLNWGALQFLGKGGGETLAL